MRLIDADLLKENISRWLKPSASDATEKIEVKDAFISMMIELEEQPIAYDVDKVVEQLKEVEKIMKSPVTKDCFGKECRASDCTVCLISKAIEIVKGGGVE